METTGNYLSVKCRMTKAEIARIKKSIGISDDKPLDIILKLIENDDKETYTENFNDVKNIIIRAKSVEIGVTY